MMMVSVVFAFLRVGSRKAITPLLTASTPVIAVQPEEKTLSTIQMLSAEVAAGIAGSGEAGCSGPPWKTCHAPTPITIKSVPVNRYVGIMKTTPVSWTPRMLTRVRRASTPRQSGKV